MKEKSKLITKCLMVDALKSTVFTETQFFHVTIIRLVTTIVLIFYSFVTDFINNMLLR